MNPYQRYADVAREVAARAAHLIRGNFLGAFAVANKGPSDLVTAVDRASEALIVGELDRAFPDHAVVAEEGARREGGARAFRWLVDPLDGTNNFAHGYPMVSVSLALEHEGAVVAGVVWDVLLDECFWATRGGGAYNDRGPLKVSKAERLGDALVSTGFPYDKHESPIDNLGNFARVTKRVQGIRRGGSAALDLAWTAAGRLDAFWELKLAPWDDAAGTLLVTEAGGRVSRIDGSPFTPGDVDLVATNGLVHDDLRALLALEG